MNQKSPNVPFRNKINKNQSQGPQKIYPAKKDALGIIYAFITLGTLITIICMFEYYRVQFNSNGPRNLRIGTISSQISG